MIIITLLNCIVVKKKKKKEWCDSVQKASAGFRFAALNRGIGLRTCRKVWNTSFKYDHISELAGTYPVARGLLRCCLSQCLFFREGALFFFSQYLFTIFSSVSKAKEMSRAMWHATIVPRGLSSAWQSVRRLTEVPIRTGLPRKLITACWRCIFRV